VVNPDSPEKRIPPGQRTVDALPVLHHGDVPLVNLQAWRMRLYGRVRELVELTFEEFARLPRISLRNDVHCVTGWSRLNNTWGGVAASTVLGLVDLLPDALYVIVHAEGGWTTNLRVDDLRRGDVLFALILDGKPLSPEHGWPVRLVVPHLYFWKSAKWVTGIEFVREDRPGFWERAGYHMRGDPWKEQRYRD